LAITGAFVGIVLWVSAAFGQGTLTTNDGLALSLSATGSVSSLKVSGIEYASAMASGFFYKEAAVGSANLATNGSFESGSGTPTGWSISGGTGGTWSIDTTTYSDGIRSMKLSIPGTTSLRSPDFYTTAKFPLLPNTPYTMSCAMKTSGLSSGLTLYLLQQDSSGVWSQIGLSSVTGTSGWQTYSMTITTAPNIVQGYLKAYLSSGYGTVWIDNAQLIDVFGGSAPAAFGGTVTSSGGTLTQTASTNNLNLSATFTGVGSAIRVDATLTDTTGADRGIELSYRLPLNVPGWTWDDDFINPRTIAAGTRYESLDGTFGHYTMGHTYSNYPFATVRSTSAAISMAVPMGPTMDRFSYDTSYGFRFTSDIGLSPAATKSPSKATISFWIYTQNPKWGLRTAAERYYSLNPSSFTSNATTLGAWAATNVAPLSSVPSPLDFGWAYQEFDTELSFDNANGILGFHYLSPTSWTRKFPQYAGQSQPAYSILANTLVSDSQDLVDVTEDGVPVSTMATSVINTAPYDQNGLYQLGYNSYFWNVGGWQMYPMLPDPDIAGSRYWIAKQYSVDNRISAALSAGETLGGIFLDNVSSTFSNVKTTANLSGPTSTLP